MSDGDGEGAKSGGTEQPLPSYHEAVADVEKGTGHNDVTAKPSVTSASLLVRKNSYTSAVDRPEPEQAKIDP